MLTARWTPMRYHAGQHAYMHSNARFNVLPCGRRSGKTERAKRKLVMRAIQAIKAIREKTWPWHNARFFAAAPTFAQAKRIYWADLKALIPPQYMAGKPKESDLIIPMQNDVEIHVLGMDKPERFEGSPWNGGILDEYGNMRAEAWAANIRPGLSDRKGWCDLIGVPEGRNHYYDIYCEALADTSGEWAVFTWPSSDILDTAEIESARRTLDELTFRQEYEASFVSFTGRAYYNFDQATHTSKALVYNPRAPLVFCFDFNVSPGVAVILQEQILPGCFEHVPNPRLFRSSQAFRLAMESNLPDAFVRRPVTGTGVIGEVHIPQNSTTPAVCRRLVQDWGDHEGDILCYGDATGGAAGTAKVSGSDWQIIYQMLSQHFGDRVEIVVPKTNPPERARVNAVNGRLKAADGTVRLLVDPSTCPMLVRDLEGVRVLEGGSGEIDKKHDKKLTHISDALGYYIAYEYPVSSDQYMTEMPVAGRF